MKELECQHYVSPLECILVNINSELYVYLQLRILWIEVEMEE